MSEVTKVIVFGGSGFIGKNICQHLNDNNEFDTIAYSKKDVDLLDFTKTSQIITTCSPNTSILICSAITRSQSDSWETFLKTRV